MPVNEFLEGLLQLTTDINTAKGNPRFMFYPELSDILKELNGGVAQEMNLNNFETCLFEVLKTEDGQFFENSQSRWMYLKETFNALAISNSSPLNKEETAEVQKIICGYSINLVCSPWMFSKEQLDKNMTILLCKECFESKLALVNNHFLEMCFETLNDEKDKEKSMVVIDILCNYQFFKKESPMNEQLIAVKNALGFFTCLFGANPFIFKAFTESQHSVGADWIKTEKDPRVFAQKHFALRFLNFTYFPWENKAPLAIFFATESFRTSASSAKPKTLELQECLYNPFCQFIELFLDENSLIEQVVTFAERVLVLNRHKLREMRVQGVNSTDDGFGDGLFFNFVFIFNSLVGGFIPVNAKYEEIFDKHLDSSLLLRSEILQEIGLIDYNDPDAVKSWREANREKPKEGSSALGMTLEEEKSEQINSERAFGSRLYVVASYANHLLGNIWKKYFVQTRFAFFNQNEPSIQAQYTACQVHINDPEFFKFFVFIGVLDSLALSRIVLPKGEGIPKAFEKSLNGLFGRKPPSLGLIPVFLLENINAVVEGLRVDLSWLADSLSYSHQKIPHLDKFFEFASVLYLHCLGNKEWCINPHLRAKFMQSLGFFMDTENQTRSSFLAINTVSKIGRFLVNSPAFQTHSVQSLMTFFIDIEKTGSHNQFFQKFQYRHSFFQCVNFCLKELPAFKTRVQEFVDQNKEMALRFMNLLLNDLIFLLDDALAKVAEIKRLEVSFETNQNNHALLATIAQEHSANIRVAQGILGCLYCHYETLLTFSLCVPRLFLEPEIIDKLCANINYTMVQFHSSDSAGKLRLKNPHKINFHPEKITGSLARVLISMKDFSEIYKGLIRDGRSFSMEIYNLTGYALYGRHILNNQEIKQFEEFFERLEAKNKKAQEMEKNIEEADVPEEFLDPIMNEIMRNPVLLPTSNKIVDRMTIMKHLLSDQTDPFNRQPLEAGSLVPQVTLKAQIDEFLSKLKKK